MVLNEEVLGTKKVFWLSVVGIAILAFFSGTNMSITVKLIAIIFSVVLIFFFWNPFRKILRFSEGYRPEFEISFLKGLNFSRLFRFQNKLKMERMVRAWTSFWSEKTPNNERDFTKEFINHVDRAVKNKKYDLAVTLAQVYEKNIEKRDRFQLGYEMLPKLFDWNATLWKALQKWLANRTQEEKIQKMFSQKYFPTFKKWTLYFHRKICADDDFFWNWHYFDNKLFPSVAKVLLNDGHGPYQLFAALKKYVEEVELGLEKIKGDVKKQRWWDHIQALFGSFCPMFFENIDNVFNKAEIWEHYFPQDWKITVANSENKIPRIILYEFLQWAQHRIHKKNKTDFDKDLTEVVEGLFPNAHHRLFPTFLVLLFSPEIEDAVQKDASFFLTNVSVTWSGELNDKEIQQMFEYKNQSQKGETINMILEYFKHWKLLRLYKSDITEKESSDWSTYSEEQRKLVTNRVRKIKLQDTLEKLNGVGIIDLCRESERREDQRKNLVELIQLLLEQIQKT